MIAQVSTTDPRQQRGTDTGVVFATGTGRCGTQFLARLLELEPDVAAFHERNPLGDSFHRYCVLNTLPVDQFGFIAEKRAGIAADLRESRVSFESSSYLALSCQLLFEQFRAKFILLTRRPDKVVNSYYKKGWFEHRLIRENPILAPGYQPEPQRAHHPFSRTIPRGPEAVAWDGYTRVGKIAWMWQMINRRVLEQFGHLPSANCRVVKLEDLSYPTYRELCDYMGFAPKVTRQQFDALSQARPNALHPTRGVHDWSDQESHEFESEVSELAERLGYPWRVAELRNVRGVASPVPNIAAAGSDARAKSSKPNGPIAGFCDRS